MGSWSLPRVVIMYDALFNTGNWLDIENGVRYLAEQVDCHHWCHRNHLDSSWTLEEDDKTHPYIDIIVILRHYSLKCNYDCDSDYLDRLGS